jgi:hypothetical protein
MLFVSMASLMLNAIYDRISKIYIEKIVILCPYIQPLKRAGFTDIKDKEIKYGI